MDFSNPSRPDPHARTRGRSSTRAVDKIPGWNLLSARARTRPCAFKPCRGCRSPPLAPLSAPAGTLAWYEATLEWLGATPLTTIAGSAARPGPPCRPLGRKAADEWLLVELRDDGGMALGTASEPLVRLLGHATTPRTRAALAAEAVTRGASSYEAPALLEGLLAEGLLVAE